MTLSNANPNVAKVEQLSGTTGLTKAAVVDRADAFDPLPWDGQGLPK